MHQASILSNKKVICRLIITPTHKIKMAAPMWTQDGHYKMASRGGQLWAIRPVGEKVRKDQACKGGQLGMIKPAGKGS